MALALGFAAVVGFFAFLERPQRVAAKSPAEESTSQPLVRSDPGVEPWQEKEISAPPAAEEYSTPQPESTQPESEADRDDDGSALPLQEDEYPLPTQEQIASANQPRRYHLPPGAIMALTIPELGIRNAPVMDSVTESTLNQGVVHLPDTSLPWSDTPERNVYLAGHRLGWPGHGKPPHLLPPQRANRRGEDHTPRQGRHEIRLQGAGKLRRMARRELGNRQGEGSGPRDAADMRADTDVPEEAHRSSRTNLAIRHASALRATLVGTPKRAKTLFGPALAPRPYSTSLAFVRQLTRGPGRGLLCRGLCRLW